MTAAVQQLGREQKKQRRACVEMVEDETAGDECDGQREIHRQVMIM